MLAVGIEEHDVVVLRGDDSTLERRAVAPVDRMGDDRDGELPGNARSPVRRAVVDHDDLGAVTRPDQLVQDCPEPRLLVERRDDDAVPHHERPSIQRGIIPSGRRLRRVS